MPNAFVWVWSLPPFASKPDAPREANPPTIDVIPIAIKPFAVSFSPSFREYTSTAPYLVLLLPVIKPVENASIAPSNIARIPPIRSVFLLSELSGLITLMGSVGVERLISVLDSCGDLFFGGA